MPASWPQRQTVRLALLEDLNAIRALNQAWARHVNAVAHEEIAALFADPSLARIGKNIRGLRADHSVAEDALEVAAGGATATARVHCIVETETAIEPSCPLVEMAREQGGGGVRSTERGVFENVCVRREGLWKIQSSTYRPAPPDRLDSA